MVKVKNRDNTFALQYIAEMLTAAKLLSTFLFGVFSMCHYAVNWCDELRFLHLYLLFLPYLVAGKVS